MILKFDEEKHEYTLYDKDSLTERVLISVTTALKNVGIVDDRFFKESGTRRGTLVHKLTEDLDNENLNWANVTEEVLPYLKAWIAFKAMYNPVVMHVELPVYNEKLGYAGTIDRILTINGEEYIIDIKSGAKEKWHALQLTMYGLCQPEMPKLACVYLKKNGKFKFEEYRPDIKTAEAIMRVYNWKIS